MCKFACGRDGQNLALALIAVLFVGIFMIVASPNSEANTYDPPELTTREAKGIHWDRAVLIAEIRYRESDNIDIQFYYRENKAGASWNFTPLENGYEKEIYSRAVSGLESNKEYEYYAYTEGENDWAGRKSLTTLDNAYVKTGEVLSWENTRAKINYKVELRAYPSADVYIDYGGGSDLVLDNVTEDGWYENTITGLSDNTSYEWRARLVDPNSLENIAIGENKTFRTFTDGSSPHLNYNGEFGYDFGTRYRGWHGVYAELNNAEGLVVELLVARDYYPEYYSLRVCPDSEDNVISHVYFDPEDSDNVTIRFPNSITDNAHVEIYDPYGYRFKKRGTKPEMTYPDNYSYIDRFGENIICQDRVCGVNILRVYTSA